MIVGTIRVFRSGRYGVLLEVNNAGAAGVAIGTQIHISVCQKKVGGLKNGETRPFDTRSIHL